MILAAVADAAKAREEEAALYMDAEGFPLASLEALETQSRAGEGCSSLRTILDGLDGETEARQWMSLALADSARSLLRVRLVGALLVRGALVAGNSQTADDALLRADFIALEARSLVGPEEAVEARAGLARVAALARKRRHTDLVPENAAAPPKASTTLLEIGSSPSKSGS